MSGAGEDVHLRIDGKAGHVTLNRPKALNALTHEMAIEIARTLRLWARDDAAALVLIDAAGDRAFCAGGDIQKVYHQGRAGDLASVRRFWADEYRLNALIHRYPKPYVALMDGIVMGGGVGLSAHGSHRVVTERSMVAMPECAIGLVPDIGSSLILAEAPGRLGEYLALTGHRMKAGDAIHAGFADHFVPAEQLQALTERLLETGDPAVIDEFTETPPAAPLLEMRERIDAAFEAEDVKAIVARLEADHSDWAEDTLKAIRRGSPISLAATLRNVRTVREDPTIETALRHEYRFSWRSMDEGELLEGIRAAVIDKDRDPQWRPAALEDLDSARVDAITASLGPDELTLGERP